MKRHLKVIALVATILGAGCIVAVGSANAIDRGTIRKFAENNIYFYDPDGVRNSCSVSSSQSTSLAGITPERQSSSSLENAKMVLDKLMKAGYSPIAAAAIAGNLDWEGGFWPCKVENGGYDGDGNHYKSGAGCDTINRMIDTKGNSYITEILKDAGSQAGVGIVQWTSKNRKENLIKEANKNNVRATDLDTQVNFLVSELQTWNSDNFPSTISTLNELSKGTDGLILATWRIYRYYETPGTSFRWEGGSREKGTYGTENKKQPTDPLALNEIDHAGAYREFYGHRLPSALYYLNLLEASGAVNLNPGKGQNQVPESEILIVAESVDEGLKNAITSKLPNVEFSDTVADAKKYTVYVSEITAENIKDKIEEIAGQIDSEKNIFFVSNQTAVVNAAKEVAKSNENVKVIGYSVGYEEKAVETLMQGIQSMANAKNRSINSCLGGTIDGVTYKTIDGVVYAWPHPGTTKKNYNKNSKTGQGLSLSGFCSLEPDQYKEYRGKNADGTTAFGWCGTHHDYAAVDLGRGGETDSGTAEGIPVVAFTEGTIKYSEYNEGYNPDGDTRKCAAMFLTTPNGTKFWLGHFSYDEKFAALDGQNVAAGTVIGEVGPPKCAAIRGTASPHTHIDERCSGSNGTDYSGTYKTSEKFLCMPAHSYYVTTHLNYLMNELYAELPE